MIACLEWMVYFSESVSIDGVDRSCIVLVREVDVPPLAVPFNVFLDDAPEWLEFIEVYECSCKLHSDGTTNVILSCKFGDWEHLSPNEIIEMISDMRASGWEVCGA